MLNADLKENKKTTTFCRGEMLKTEWCFKQKLSSIDR